jgi:hypothetical protein
MEEAEIDKGGSFFGHGWTRMNTDKNLPFLSVLSPVHPWSYFCFGGVGAG